MINPQSFVLNWSLLSKFHWASFIRKSSPILLCQEESSIVPKVSYLSKASDIFGITTANGSALNSTTSLEESYSSNSERLWYCPSSWSRPMVASKGEAMKQWIEEMRGSREIKFCIMHFAEKKLAKKQLFTWILIFVTHWALLTGDTMTMTWSVRPCDTEIGQQVIRDELDRLGTLGSSNVILRHEMPISDQFTITDIKRRWRHNQRSLYCFKIDIHLVLLLGLRSYVS